MLDFFSILKLNGFPVLEAQKIYNKILEDSVITEYQDEQKWKQFDFHLKNNTFYRNFFGERKVTDWNQIPIITKAHLMGDYQQRLPQKITKDKLYVSRTSGSTGTPMMFARERLFHVMVWLSVNNIYQQHYLSVNDMQARFYGIPLTGFHYYKEKLKDKLANRYRFVVYNLNDEVLGKWVNIFTKKKFQCIYGYTNSIVQFGKYILSKGICLKEICPTLKGCIVTSEMCSGDEMKMLQDAFGVKVFNEYGASEVCVIGFRKKDCWDVAKELVYLEVVDDEGKLVQDGKKGHLLITLLHNKATPIIRYDIGDVASIQRNGSNVIIQRLEGRSNDMGVLPSGKKVPGLTFYYAVHEAIGDDVKIKEHQVVQKDVNCFEVNIRTAGGVTNIQKDKIREAFDIYLEKGLKVVVNKVNNITRSKKGKFKHFISEL